jgi:hypothetical protein
MSAWKVLFTLVFACACFALAAATVVVPLTQSAAEYRWQWLGGLLLGTACMGALLALFLRRASRSMSQSPARAYTRRDRPEAGRVIRF